MEDQPIETYVKSFRERFFGYLCDNDRMFEFVFFVLLCYLIYITYSQGFRDQVANYANEKTTFCIDLADLNAYNTNLYSFFMECTYRFLFTLFFQLFVMLTVLIQLFQKHFIVLQWKGAMMILKLNFSKLQFIQKQLSTPLSMSLNQ